MLNATSLSKCKTGARVINCARGGVVNEKDLLDALNSGQVSLLAQVTLAALSVWMCRQVMAWWSIPCTSHRVPHGVVVRFVPSLPATLFAAVAAVSVRCFHGVSVIITLQIAGAAIDAFESEPLKDVSLQLATHANVICTPHIGASTKESQFRVARDIATYLHDALEKRKYFGVVNADSLDMHLRR